MKKFIIAIFTVFLFTFAYYNVSNYNKSRSSTTTEKTATKTKPTEEKEAPYIKSDNESTAASSSNSTDSSTFEAESGVFKTKAPGFILEDLSGNSIDLNKLKGKKVLLNFWATWCPPCRGEMPDLDKLNEEIKDKNIVILAINIGEDRSTVKSFMNKNNYKFQVLLDVDESIAGLYNIAAIPTSYFIDDKGIIQHKVTGAMTLENMKVNLEKLDKNS